MNIRDFPRPVYIVHTKLQQNTLLMFKRISLIESIEKRMIFLNPFLLSDIPAVH